MRRSRAVLRWCVRAWWLIVVDCHTLSHHWSRRSRAKVTRHNSRGIRGIQNGNIALRKREMGVRPRTDVLKWRKKEEMRLKQEQNKCQDGKQGKGRDEKKYPDDEIYSTTQSRNSRPFSLQYDVRWKWLRKEHKSSLTQNKANRPWGQVETQLFPNLSIWAWAFTRVMVWCMGLVCRRFSILWWIGCFLYVCFLFHFWPPFPSLGRVGRPRRSTHVSPGARLAIWCRGSDLHYSCTASNAVQ